MIRKKMSGILCLVFIILLSSNCKKQTILKKQEKHSEESSDGIQKSLPIGATIKSISIAYLNQVGTGFQMASTYFSKDFNGDGIADVLMRKSDGNVYLYLGSATSSWPSGSFPDKVGDALGGVTYKLTEGILVGNGWNFVRYFAADFNGDHKCDIIGQNADGRMWLYTSNGTGFSSGVIQTRFGQAQPWSLTNTFIPADKNGDGIYELLEISDLGPNGYRQTSWIRYDAYSTTWNSYGSAINHSAKDFDKDDQYFPINIDGDSDVDLFILKSNGNMYYSKCFGINLPYSAPVYVGHGWDNFQDVYGSYHWNCFTPIASLTGRKSNGDFYTYKWNSSSNTFSEGVKVGTGWGFEHILTGNFIPDVSSRQDFLGINSDGKMHAYCTLAILN